MNVMRTDHVFPHVREDTKAKRLWSQTKEVVADVYDYFEELHRCQCTQGPLKRTADATGVSHYLKVWNLKYDEGMSLEMYGVCSLLLSRSTREPNFIYK